MEEGAVQGMNILKQFCYGVYDMCYLDWIEIRRAERAFSRMAEIQKEQDEWFRDTEYLTLLSYWSSRSLLKIITRDDLN